MTQYLDLDQRQQHHQPSPDRYIIPSRVGNAPKISLASRTYTPSTALAPNKYLIHPEPATYQIKSSIGRQSPMITMAGRVRTEAISTVPGPGAYSPSNKLQFRNLEMNIASRPYLPVLSPKHEVPGPESYSLPTKIGEHIKSSFGIRTNYRDFSKVNKDYDNVGPGSHQIKTMIGSNVKNSLASRTYVKNAFNSPGPGSYDIKNSVGAAVKISLASRPDKRGLILLDSK